jgi:hypothetical protein
MYRAVFKGRRVYGLKSPEILEKKFLAHENLQFFQLVHTDFIYS